jgi:hypothetical protein
MVHSLLLNELKEDKLDTVLSLNETGKTIFFDSLIKNHFPHIEKNSNEYKSLQVHYRCCWMMEKIYRNNQFMKECFSVVYTKTGLIRNIWNDLYYTDDDLIIH